MIKQRANETTTNTTGLGEEAVVVGKLPLSAMINIFDFEKIARTEMLSMGKKEGWVGAWPFKLALLLPSLTPSLCVC